MMFSSGNATTDAQSVANEPTPHTITIAEPLPPHMELLWACLASGVSGNQTSLCQAMHRALAGESVDWPACARASIRHGLASIAAHSLAACAVETRLPAEATACFARLYRANGHRNEALFQACGRLLRGFQESGIPCLVLKGIGLALTVYPNPALRNCADIDLLVPPGDLDRACEIAQSLGFAPRHAEADDCLLHRTLVGHSPEDILTETLPLEYEEEALRAKAEAHCRRVVVEIHHGLFRDGAGMMRKHDAAPLWHAPRRACLPDGTPLQMPSYEVTLVHLAAHAADHGYARLIYFYDIAAIIRQEAAGIDWDLTLDLAARYEVGSYAYQCLEFVTRECHLTIPAHVLAALRRSAGRRVRPLRRSDILGAEREISTGIVLQRLLLSHNAREFIGTLRAILFPPPVILRRLYSIKHPLLVGLFYVLRPFLLVGHLCRLLWRRLHG